MGSRTFECRPCVDDYEKEYVAFFYPHIYKAFSYLSISGPTDQAMDRNTVVFHVDITCERNPKAPKGSTNDHELYINHEVLSSHLVWVPAGEQEEVFTGKPPAPINPNIVLAKLRPGQRVNMELHAVKGVGKDHAKFSPVGMSSIVLFHHHLLFSFSRLNF